MQDKEMGAIEFCKREEVIVVMNKNIFYYSKKMYQILTRVIF